MTQVFGAAYRHMLFHASDRLLSTVPDLAPHDRRTNKSLVVQCKDSICLLGYSGYARMRVVGKGKPVATDEWIAGALTTPRDQRWSPPNPGHDLGHLSFGQLRDRLVAHLDAYLDRFSDAREAPHLVTVQAIGFLIRVGDRRGKPFASVVEAACGSVGVEHLRLDGYSLIQPGIVATPALTDQQWRQVNDSLLANRTSPGAMLEGFKSSVRAIAAERTGVGPDLMTMVFVVPTGELWIGFDRADGAPELVSTDTVDVPVVYTPWILHPGDIYRPKMASRAEGLLGSPPFKVLYCAPEGPPGRIVWVDHDRAATLSEGSRKIPGGSRQMRIALTPGKHTISIRRSPPQG